MKSFSPSRPWVGTFALLALLALTLWDAQASGLPAPHLFDAPFALGSGAAPTGAHCTAN